MGRALLLLSATLILPSCASLTGSGANSYDDAYWHKATIAVACASYQPIYWSSTDTDQTIRQAKAHNAVGIQQCGWKPASLVKRRGPK